ncbi:dnaJ chaperone-like protein [Geopyxis carbonaria]|nr:dnaJ chaperone-like protein [Geopyxis carbonaria]
MTSFIFKVEYSTNSPQLLNLMYYYAALGVSSSATVTQIRDAYKRAALKTHPDRVSHDDPTRATRTKKFQQVNDAYYVLSDPKRRQEYDATRSYGRSSKRDPQWQDDQFADVFEEMMQEEGLNDDGTPATGTRSLWSLLGGVSGATIGFIVGNVPGMLAGAVAGNRLGAVRDKKGKSVYEAFQELPQNDKAKLLSDLAAKILSHAVS